jgi:hypothetical protein
MSSGRWCTPHWPLRILCVDLTFHSAVADTAKSFLRALHALRPPSEPQSNSVDPTRIHVPLNDNTWFSGATTSMGAEPSLQAKEEGSATVSEGSLLEFTCQI